VIPFALQVRALLYPFLMVVSAALGALLLALLVHRVGVAWLSRRRARLAARYQPLVDRLLLPAPDLAALDALAQAPPRHREVIATLLLAPLVVTTGETRRVVHEACARLELDRVWRAALDGRRWWRRAEAARALGAIADPVAFASILRLLEDDHEEVRAAAVDALGSFQDARALPSLTALLALPWRHQRARVVEAIRRHGAEAIEALIDRARIAPEDRLVVAELLGLIRAPKAIDLLVEWLSAREAPLRAAAMQSLGGIGLDDRTFYYALRALGDAAPEVRAAAARSLGRSRRADGSQYLEPLLDDEWAVAAQAASALRQLGAPGQLALRRRAAHEGQAGDLARQMLWERQAAV